MTPTIINERGFRVTIFFNDHPPPHVHVYKDNREARVYLTPVSLWDSDMKPKDSKQAVEIVQANRDTLVNKWTEIHGDEADDDD